MNGGSTTVTRKETEASQQQPQPAQIRGTTND